MNIKNISLYKFKIPFKSSIRLNNIQLHHRSGYIIGLESNDNKIGYGEISPLPGSHKETLDDVLRELKTYREKSNSIEKSYFSPSLKFGIDSALLNLKSKQNGKSQYQLLSDKHNQTITINGLIVEPEKDLELKIKMLFNTGYNTIKIKVGRLDIDQEIKIVKQFNKLADNKIKLRLDANCKWSYSEAEYFYKSIKSSEILEYIEEPLSDVHVLEKLYRDKSIPLALDENLEKIKLNYPKLMQKAKALILKPPIIGSLNKTLDYINYSKANNISPVISDTFQSGFGISMLCFLASSIPQKSTAMGLNTYDYLKDDILINRLKFDNGKIDLYSIDNSLNMNKLTKVKI